MKNIQANRMLKLLKSQPWVCVEDFTKLYIVDYRRRISDLKERGFQFESKKCELHNYHKGGSKMWHLKIKIPTYRYEEVNGRMIEYEISGR